MEKGTIGVQMMMLKQEVANHGIYAVMERLALLGFHAVEVSQLDMTPENIAQLQKGQKDYGVKVAAMSCGLDDLSPEAKYPGDTLVHDFDKIVADCHAVDCSILRIGMLPMSYAASPEGMLEVADILEGYAARLKQEGIDFYYHAHTFEFYRWQGKTILEHMRDRSTYMGFELDSHWMWRGGVDPKEFIGRFAGRVRAIHLKDYRIGLVADPMGYRPGFDIFGSIEQFAEVGEGVLDMASIIPAGLAAGSEFFFIEQDKQYGRNVYDCLTLSRDNLIKLGYESWL